MKRKGCFWQISSIKVCIWVFGAFLYFNPSTGYVFLNMYWAKFDESYKENEIGA